MFKPPPEKFESIPRSPYATLDPKKLHAAAEKALNHYLKQNNTKSAFRRTHYRGTRHENVHRCP